MRHTLIIFVIYHLISCNSSAEKQQKATEYIAVYKSDTAYLSIQMTKNKFYGTLKILNRGTSHDYGMIEGDIHNDSLIGTYYYQPYRAKDKKRKAFALLKTSEGFIEGNGLQKVYMGIPSYIPESLSFNNAKFIFIKK